MIDKVYKHLIDVMNQVMETNIVEIKWKIIETTPKTNTKEMLTLTTRVRKNYR